MCSKCNEVFETDSEYIQHYNEKHKAEEKEQEQKQGASTVYLVVVCDRNIEHMI